MKQLTTSLRRAYRFRIIVLSVAIVAAVTFAALNLASFVNAQSGISSHYWGADSADHGYWKYCSDGTYAQAVCPTGTVSVPLSVYIGKMGCATDRPRYEICTNWDQPDIAVNGVPASAKYVYWYLFGPGYGDSTVCGDPKPYLRENADPSVPSECSTIPDGLQGIDLQLYRYGCHQANAFVTKYADYSANFQGNTLFGDIENPIGSGLEVCGWGALGPGDSRWPEQLRKNNLVLQGYLAQMRIRLLPLGKRLGLYVGEKTFPSIVGTNYQLPSDVVLWLAKYNCKGCYPNLNNISVQASAILTTPYFGHYPVMWQFHDPDFDVTNQNPAQGFSPRSIVANVDAVLIIDSSGSMSTNDPQDERKEASRIFVSNNAYKNDYVGVVDFDHTIEATTSLQLLPDNEGSVIAAINAIDSSGGTDIGIGVQSGCDILNLSNRSNYGKGAILLTDGDGAFAGQDQCFKAKGWPIFAFGFGSANDTLLQQIASNTGGTYTRVTNLTSLTCEFIRVRSLIANVVPPPCGVSHVPQLATVALTQTVALGQGQATFSTGWPGSDVVMTLTSPSGRVIDRNTVAPDVNHENGATYEIYTIAYPEPGDWHVSLYGADVPASGEDVVFGFASLPEPVMGSLTLTPIADARVKQEDPTSNYGTSGMLDADGSSGNVVQSYLRFNVSGVTGPLKRAVLRLHEASNGTANGPQLFATSNAWEETTITWNNRPAPLGTALANAGVISVGTWVEYDVTAFVTSNGIYNFVLIPDSTDGVEFSSRQGDALPELVLTLAQDSMPNPRPFGAQADARVRQGNPTTNYGTSSRLDADGSNNAVVQSYLRFNVSDLTRPVQRAVLRLQATSNGTANGPQLFATSGTWEEMALTWNNRPAPVGTVLGNIGIISPNTWIEYDVTGLIAGDGTYNFVLIPESSDGVEFSSRQGDGMPQLLITVAP